MPYAESALWFRGRMLHCKDDSPASGYDVEYLDDGVMVVDQGKIKLLCDAATLTAQGADLSRCRQLGKRLMVPGFIDTHIHSAQAPVLASYGEQLLKWLEKYTFPAEQKMADIAYAEKIAGEFLDTLLACGTTTAMVFTTSHAHSCDLLFQQAQARKLCLIAGKVLMDCNAPQALLDDPRGGVFDSRKLIEKWHQTDRLHYAVTPRFSITSSPLQLQLAGDLFNDYPKLYMQTHLSENHDEVATVKQLFPDAKNYLDTYDSAGLLNERSLFAHCLHLHDAEVERLAQRGGKVAFCPTSNLFLGSGLLDLQRLEDAGIGLSIATDVGAGTSYSQLRTLGDAYKVCQLTGSSFTPMKAFYMLTLGNAKALSLDHSIGNFSVGKDADFLILNPDHNTQVARRAALCNDIAEEWFVYMTLGDERLIQETWIAGQCQFNGSPTHLEAA